MEILKRLWTPKKGPTSQAEVISRIGEAMAAEITRGRMAGDRLEFGPNLVHAYIVRGPSGDFGKPGTTEDLGWSKNIKTTVGMDWLHNSMGGVAVPTTNSPGTSITGSAGSYSFTGTGSGLTANALRGYRAVFPVTGITTKPVYANIAGNTTSALYLDDFYVEAETAGTAPAGTNAYTVLPGQGPAKFIALTTDTGTPAVGDTSLTGEITTNGLQRALATFAHTGATTTYTLTKTFNATGTHTNVHKAGNFTCNYHSTASPAGILVADTNLNADATLASGDSLAVTWTWTLPAAG